VKRNKNDLNYEKLINLDKSTLDTKMKEIEELFEEIKERELQKTTDETRKKGVLIAYDKAIKELNKAKEQIENSRKL
jgi:uncharacterized protein (UPF0264 family)